MSGLIQTIRDHGGRFLLDQRGTALTDYCVLLAIAAILVLLLVNGVAGYLADAGERLGTLFALARTWQ